MISLSGQSITFTSEQIGQIRQVYNLISNIRLSINQRISWLYILINQNMIQMNTRWRVQLNKMKYVLNSLQSGVVNAAAVQLNITEKIMLVNLVQNFSLLQG
jgi:hypothetical protein